MSSILCENVLYKVFKYNVNKGKYLIDILGFKRITEMDFPNANLGYQFVFSPVDDFEAYADPREDDKYTSYRKV